MRGRACRLTILIIPYQAYTNKTLVDSSQPSRCKYIYLGYSILWVLAVLSGTGLAALYTDPNSLPQTQYDFIIIGGGTAGSVIANRLSENATVSILVVEAGIANDGSDADIIQIPFLVSETTGSMYDWNYTTVPQAGLNGRSIAYPRGYVLGGSSSINNMAYTRGPVDDYNRLANVSGDQGWSAEQLWPYAFKNEKWVAPYDNHNTTGQYNPAVHSTEGLLDVSLDGYPAEIDDLILNVTQQMPSDFPFNLDMNSGYPIGIGWLQSSIGGGARSSAATAYLTPASSSRSNLDVLIQTQAVKLLQSQNAGRKARRTPAFNGVQVASRGSSETTTLIATKEIILSAGTIGTPQLLMLSGIGNQTELSQLGISTVANLPDVGKNLQDQPFFPVQWTVSTNATWDTIVDNPTLFDQALQQYEATKQGLMASNAIANQIAFLRLPNTSSVIQQYGDPSSGPSAPHYELTFSNGFVTTTQTPPTSGNYFSVTIILLTPTSRGSVTLSSSSPWDYPNIDPAFYTTDFDIAVILAAAESLQQFVSASPWQDYLVALYPDAAQLTSVSAFESYARTWAASVRHPVGTAVISKLSDEGGVVGPDLTVKGVQGLRVVDASIFPFSPAAHPQAAVYIVAERAADLIKSTYGLN